MAILTYLNFDLLIERAGDRYRARVLKSPGGEASLDFDLPFTREKLQIFVLKAISLGTRRQVRRMESPEMKEIKTFGRELFEAVFDDRVHDCLRLSLRDAERESSGLRIRLRLDDTGHASQPDREDAGVSLSDVPWEFMYDSGGAGFLCLSTASPIVRYQDLVQPIEPVAVKPPLRLLVMISAPRDVPQLDVEHERTKLEEALRAPLETGQIAIDWMEDATLQQLQRRLRVSKYHAFHFIGHGGYDDRTGAGALLLEDERGRSNPVSAEFLRTLFQNHRTLQLAILNACEGARTDPTDPFAGVAQSLVRGGVTAVIAMQFEISDDAAIILSSEFYSALADGYPVDAALAEARTAVYTRTSAVEWAVPVLYLRSPDASIFDVETSSSDVEDVTKDVTAEEKEKEEKEEEPSGTGPIEDEREDDRSWWRRWGRRRLLPIAAALIVIAAIVLIGMSLIGDAPGGPLAGDILFVREGEILAVDPATQAETPLAEADANDFAPSLSPDGTQVAFGGGPVGTAEDIFRADTDGRELENLTNSSWDEESADWSPDGSRIVFDRKVNDNFDIYVMNTDGSGIVQLTRDDADDKRPEWSPDGSQIAFESSRFGASEVFVMDADGRNVRRLTGSGSDDGAPVWSKDGRSIAFRSNRGGDGYEVWIMSAEGEDERQVTQVDGDVRAPAWSPDGPEIVYSSNSGGNYDLYIVEVDSGESRIVVETPRSERGANWCCF
ncbi:MAG TPA: CHAT domain-containing protein [Actinomycetota bacterium]|nr:CHAT domain-containing protein [Actinomycetota bacterium]